MLNEEALAYLAEMKSKGVTAIQWCYVWDNDEERYEWSRAYSGEAETDEYVDDQSWFWDAMEDFNDHGHSYVGIYRVDTETLAVSKLGEAYLPEPEIIEEYYSEPITITPDNREVLLSEFRAEQDRRMEAFKKALGWK